MSTYVESDRCWNLMITTYGGQVSMLQDLDAPTARQAYRRLLPDTRPVEYINKGDLTMWGLGYRTYTDGDIKQVDIFGPEGCSLDPWKGVSPRIVDLAPQAAEQKEHQERARRRRQLADEKAAHLNVLTDLRPEISDRGYRCSCCGKMQPKDSLKYYVPEGLKKSDPPEAFREQLKSVWYGGSSRAWCSSCVPKEPIPLPKISPKEGFSDSANVHSTPQYKKPWWKMWLGEWIG